MDMEMTGKERMEPLAAAQGAEMAQYVYELPDEQIARHPLAVRDACRLLVATRNGVVADRTFRELPELLAGDTLLVYNDTKVVKARLFFRKPEGAAIEIFCLEPVSPAVYEECFSAVDPVTWKCLVGNAKKWKGDLVLRRQLVIGNEQVTLTASKTGDVGPDGSRSITFAWDNPRVPFASVMDHAGVIPIPPYLNRETETTDNTDYQTVYSRVEGSVAAPTAGLHFTDRVLEDLRNAGVESARVTLHVGAGTFRPVKSDTIGGHTMHSEYITVDRATIEKLANTGRRVYAVGTTSVRTLESLYHIGCMMAQGSWDGELPQWYPYGEGHPNLSRTKALGKILEYMDREGLTHLDAYTRIIITPGYRFRIVDGMITNFHQPGSTLLLLVAAMIGDAWKDVYKHAVDKGYRFLSYGDACLFSNL